VQQSRERLATALTGALFIWLVGTLVFYYSLVLSEGADLSFDMIVGVGGSSLLVLLAIAGVATHYYYGGRSTLFPKGWGPLVAIAAVALFAFNNAYLYYVLGYPQPSLFSFMVFWYAGLVVLSCAEYKKETASMKTRPEAEPWWFRRGRANLGVRRRIEELIAHSETAQKRIGRDLTLLIVALPIIFFEPVFLIPAGNEPRLFVDGLWTFVSIFFFALALRMRESIRASRFAIVDINRPRADAPRQVTLQGERGLLATFLIIYGLMVGFTSEVALRALSFGEQISVAQLFFYSLYLVAALLCFFIGNWAFKGSALSEIHLVERAAADELGESTGVVPVKVHPGETHSLLMDFNIVGRSSANGGTPRYYEAELHASGVDIDVDKHTLYESPATLMAAWSCRFRAAGNQAMSIVLAAVTRLHEPSTPEPEKRQTLFSYAHDVVVEGALTASKENTITLTGTFVTVLGIVFGLWTVISQYGSTLTSDFITVLGIVFALIALIIPSDVLHRASAHHRHHKR
jgi:hypothetical protein